MATKVNLLNEFCVGGMEEREDEMGNGAEGVYLKQNKDHNLGLTLNSFSGSEPPSLVMSTDVWAQNPVTVAAVHLEDQSVKRTLPFTCSSSASDAGFVVEELFFNKYGKSKLSSTDLMESRKGQWQNLYNLTGGSGKGNFHEDTPNQNRVSDDISENAWHPKGIPWKPFQTSGFSRFLVKNARMEKSRKACDEIGSTHMGPNEGRKISGTSSFASDRLKDDNVHGVSSIAPPEGMNLREWMNSKFGKVNKAERLYIFAQIVRLVDMAHSRKLALKEISPSCFELFSSNRVKYIGSGGSRELIRSAASSSMSDMHFSRKRSLEHNTNAYNTIGSKHRKLGDNSKVALNHTHCQSVSSSSTHNTDRQKSTPIDFQLENKWYTSPEELHGNGSTLSSNIYNLGVLLFELLGCFQSLEVHVAAMSDLRHRILLPTFLSENPMEAGFCLWLLHPKPSSRPTTREILESEIVCGLQESSTKEQTESHIDEDGIECELMLHFLATLKDEKLKKASKLVEDIRCLETDIEEVSKRHVSKTGGTFDLVDKKISGSRDAGLGSYSLLSKDESMLRRNCSQIESVYFAARSQIQLEDINTLSRPDVDVIRNRDRFSAMQVESNEVLLNKKPTDRLGSLFDGLCKYARYNKIEQRAILRNGDLHNSANVICSLNFDRDEDYFATAGVSKKIKIFEFDALLNDSVDIHYPVIEMTNKSKLSCVCWNNYIKNYLASTDYDGDVQLWDASTGQVISQYMEHTKRAWSADYSQVDPKKLASGSDDFLVKLWSIDEPKSIDTIRNIANVCCVQFSAHSTNFLAFGSADYKTYCYDLRNTKIPWCTLSGHGKAVSYVKFLDSETLVTASTDNTLKLWDLNKTSSSGMSPGACSLTFKGHTNEKNFVGLSVSDGYIACGSETNEVYAYHRSLPMPITSYKFGSADPLSGQETGDDNGQFVSSVCWRGKSNMVVTANSTGSIKLLQLV